MVAYRFAALAATFATAQAAFYGFNAGSTNIDGSVRSQSDFEAEFKAGAGLPGTDGQFNSARLYTMIQAGTQNTVISAIPAAISTKTNLLLGLWGSAGSDAFNQELAALKTAIQQFGSDLSKLAVGISVGSEDLYRVTPTGIANKAGVGAGPDVITNYIGQVKDLVKGTALANVPIGHVDTWTAWVNGSNSAVIEAADFLGVDGYPYFQTQSGDNSIASGKQLFFDSYDATVGVSNGKPVWVTETGWPVSGPNVGQAEASVVNAKTYWDDVECELASRNINTFWFTLLDSNSADSASFGILSDGYGSAPKYDLSCAGVKDTTSSSSSSSSASSDSSSAAASSKPAHTGAGSLANPTSGSSSASPVATGSSSSSPSSSDSSSSDSSSSGPSSSAPAKASAKPTGIVTSAVVAPSATPSTFAGAASSLTGQSAFALAAAAAVALCL